MNGKYIMLYALIVAAMLALLVVSLFDWRILNCDKPLKRNVPASGQTGAPSPATREIRTQNQRHSCKRPGSLPTFQDTQIDPQTTKSYAGYILIEDESGKCQILHRDGSMVDYIELKLRFEETNRMQANANRGN